MRFLFKILGVLALGSIVCVLIYLKGPFLLVSCSIFTTFLLIVLLWDVGNRYWKDLYGLKFLKTVALLAGIICFALSLATIFQKFQPRTTLASRESIELTDIENARKIRPDAPIPVEDQIDLLLESITRTVYDQSIISELEKVRSDLRDKKITPEEALERISKIKLKYKELKGQKLGDIGVIPGEEKSKKETSPSLKVGQPIAQIDMGNVSVESSSSAKSPTKKELLNPTPQEEIAKMNNTAQVTPSESIKQPAESAPSKSPPMQPAKKIHLLEPLVKTGIDFGQSPPQSPAELEKIIKQYLQNCLAQDGIEAELNPRGADNLETILYIETLAQRTLITDPETPGRLSTPILLELILTKQDDSRAKVRGKATIRSKGETIDKLEVEMALREATRDAWSKLRNKL